MITPLSFAEKINSYQLKLPSSELENGWICLLVLWLIESGKQPLHCDNKRHYTLRCQLDAGQLQYIVNIYYHLLYHVHHIKYCLREPTSLHVILHMQLIACNIDFRCHALEHVSKNLLWHDSPSWLRCWVLVYAALRVVGPFS